MRIPVEGQNHLISLLAAGCVACALNGASAYSARANEMTAETYTWSAELVSFDTRTNTAVVQARVESHADIDELESFSEGERLILTWAGLNRAAGIRSLDANPELTPEALSLPVEFVSAEREGRYIRFRVPVPESDVARVSDVDEGTWVTATSPKMARDWSTAVSSVRHYNDID